MVNLLQSRSQTLQKQLQDMYEQIEQTVVEMKTFDNLRHHEVIAVPKRVEVCLLPYGEADLCSSLANVFS